MKNTQIDDKEFAQARLLCGALLFSIATGLMLLITVHLASSTPGFNILQWILLFKIILFALTLSYIKHLNHVTLCAHSVITITLIALIAFVYFTGGPLRNSASIVLFLIPLLAFILLGVASAINWSLITAGSQLLLVMAAYAQHGFPMLVDLSQQNMMVLVLWTIVFVAIISAMYVNAIGKFQLIRERDIEHQQQQYFSSHDILTNLANRSMYLLRLERALARSRRNQQRVALIIINIDGFKQINQQMGEDAGDIVLKKVGDRLSSCVRSTDTVARTNSDEFAVILEDFSAVQDARRVASGIQQKLTPPIEELGNNTKVTASIGLALAPDHGLDANLLRQYAHAAMTQAKKTGNCICQYENDLS